MPLTPSKTRNLLESLGHRPRKPLGQNFLIDGNIVRKSLQLANLSANDHVVEIGPGLGTLTEAMLQAGCRVNAIELDPTLAGHLQTTLCRRFDKHISLMEGDAVQYPRAGLAPDVQNFKVVANLPYAITTPWLEAMLQAPLASEMVLMMQKEAADRLTAAPGSKAFGAISILLGATYEKAGIHRVSRSCFYPVPGVDSILIHLKLKGNPVLLGRASRDLIRLLFTQRRKQIGGLLAEHSIGKSWLQSLPMHACSQTSRPEDIPLAAWIELDRLLGIPPTPEQNSSDS